MRQPVPSAWGRPGRYEKTEQGEQNDRGDINEHQLALS